MPAGGECVLTIYNCDVRVTTWLQPMDSTIQCLPAEVQGKLRSGVAIPSLQQCVEELILNSIDAEATCVGVRMDMEAFKVQVLDNGTGMDADNLERLGNRYHTSKCRRVEDLENLRWYGFRGEALASLVSLATLVEVSSRTKSSLKTYVKVFKDGKGMAVFEAENPRPSAGTTVVICNFFHNMPVRRKRLEPVLEGERVRHRVEAISLMHPSVSFTLKNDCTAAMLVQLPKANSIYHRFVQIHSLSRAQNLGEINFTHGQFSVVGYVGREGHYNNCLQFLYVNERLLLKTRVHKLINCLLRKPSSINQKNDSPERSVGSPKHKRSQDLHGVYILNIKCCYSEYDVCLEPAKTLIEFKDWDGVMACVEEAVKTFLKRENLTVVSQNDDCVNAKPLHAQTDKEGRVGGTGQQASGSVSTTEYDIGMKLASDSVHRKAKNDESVCTESSLMLCEEKVETTELTGHLEQAKSEESTTEECRKKPPEDPKKLEPVCDHSHTAEKGAAFNGNEEQDSIMALLDEEINISPPSHSNGVTTSNCKMITQMLPDGQDTGRQRPSAGSNRRISLSDPYIHECLQAPDPSQSNMVLPTQPSKCGDKTVELKRKISLYPPHDKPRQMLNKDVASAIPLKIPKISACPKVFLRKEPGSLEQFRRVYGQSETKTLASQESQKNPARAPLIDAAGPLGAEKRLEGFCGPLGDVQVEAKRSLAAKLCHMKQHGIQNPQVLGCSPGTDVLRDAGSGSNPEPVPGCSANIQLSEKQQSTTVGDWLLHYDASLGKRVYVNKVTGLSRYEERPLEEANVRCTSDITNTAVNVLSESGVESRCYPFQRDLVLPFVPKSRSQRVISAGLDDKDTNNSSFDSLSTLYSKWNNPVFVRPPTVGLDISRQQADGLAVKIHNVLHPYRFSKAMIHSMKVIHQVDKKFLACLISSKDDQTTDFPDSEGNLLVLVDQHAAHERVRLENLIADSYEDDPAAPGERRLCSTSIVPPLEIGVTEEELRLLGYVPLHRYGLQQLRPHPRCASADMSSNMKGLEVKFSQAAEAEILVGKVPVCFTEKESNELRRGRASVIKPIVEEYLQEQLELLRSTGKVGGTLPLTVLKVLASLACHGAIKFNDSLSKEACHSLVASLSSCHLPFQCAHGRPSIAPLVDILHLDKDQKEVQKPNLQKLRRMYKAWQLYGNR